MAKIRNLSSAPTGDPKSDPRLSRGQNPNEGNNPPPTPSQEGKNDISIDKLIKAHKINIARKIQAGETGLAKELEHLQNLETRQNPPRTPESVQSVQSVKSVVSAANEIGIPEHLRIKRCYVKSPNYMSAAARNARSKAGKASRKKNPYPNWKHGKYAKAFITGSIRPCKSTCKDYPCSIINEGGTTPGDPCLDKGAVIQTYRAILDAVKNKNYGDFQEIASLTIAQSIQTLHMLLEEIIRDGTTIKREKHDKDGNVFGVEYVPHPALLSLPKMIADLGMTPQEFLATPRSIAKQGAEDEGADTLAQFLSSLGSKMQKKSEMPADNENE